MALVTCPDCGKQVSSRAKACPECGCPAEFFGIEEEKTIEDDSYFEIFEENESDNEKNESDNMNCINNVENYFASFNIMGQKIEYSKNAELYISALKMHISDAAALESAIREKYREAKNMDNVWSNVVPAVQATIDNFVKKKIEVLYRSNIYISVEDFEEKYSIHIIDYLDTLIDAYDAVVAEAEQIHKSRQYNRAGRSHWQGGGFGLSGAIKGAVTAGALNAVTGVGRGISDSIVDSSDKAKMQREKQKIYNNKNSINLIVNSFRRCVEIASLGMAEELYAAGLTDNIPLNATKAFQIYESAVAYEKTGVRLAVKVIEAIQWYPIYPNFYQTVIDAVLLGTDNDFDEWIRFMKFWNMDTDYKAFFLEAEKRKKVKDYLDNHPDIKQVNFSDFSAENYIRLREIRKVFFHMFSDGVLPQISPYCVSLQRFFDSCLDKECCLDSVAVLDDLKKLHTIDSFFNRISAEKKVLPGILKEIWVKGDNGKIPEAKLKSKWSIPENDCIYMYQNKAIFGTAFGGKGFVLTSSLICDLETKKQIRLNEVTQIQCDSNICAVIVSTGNGEIRIDMTSERLANGRFLAMCISEMINRYIEVSAEVVHLKELEKTVKRIREIIMVYAEHYNIENVDLLMEKFFKEHGYDVKPLTIFCPFCGEKIGRTVKFCNYCGKANKYGN